MSCRTFQSTYLFFDHLQITNNSPHQHQQCIRRGGFQKVDLQLKLSAQSHTYLKLSVSKQAPSNSFYYICEFFRFRAGSCAIDFQTESVLVLNKKLKVISKFQFFMQRQNTFHLKVNCTWSSPWCDTGLKKCTPTAQTGAKTSVHTQDGPKRKLMKIDSCMESVLVHTLANSPSGLFLGQSQRQEVLLLTGLYSSDTMQQLVQCGRYKFLREKKHVPSIQGHKAASDLYYLKRDGI